MAEIHVLKGPATFVCLGLGSCIGVAALDPSSGVGGMIHIMLPQAFPNRPNPQVGKFADTGLPEFLYQLVKAGANKHRVQIAYAGGAQLFSFGAEQSKLDIGGRNSEAVEQFLSANRLKVIHTDVGGTVGRTVTFSSETGEVLMKTVTHGEKPICNLRKAA